MNTSAQQIPLITHEGWAYQPEKCPADDDFVSWLQAEANDPSVSDLTVFHMGPGNHHLVGLYASTAPNNLHVTALTCSPEEVVAYLRLACSDANLARHYQVIFNDLHQLDPRAIPACDVATLFHVGEAEDDRRQIETPIQRIILRVASKVTARGYLLFYNGSSAWDRVEPVLKHLEAVRIMLPVLHWKSLTLYRLTV